MDFESLLRSENFLTFWKIASPIGAGLSAIFGLTREFKNPATGRLTTAGKVSIVGIAISATFGLFASLAERRNDLEADARAEAQLVEIRRAVTLVEDPKIVLRLKIDCKKADRIEWLAGVCSSGSKAEVERRLKSGLAANLKLRSGWSGVGFIAAFYPADDPGNEAKEMHLVTSWNSSSEFGADEPNEGSIRVDVFDDEPGLNRELDQYSSWTDYHDVKAYLFCAPRTTAQETFCNVIELTSMSLTDKSGRHLELVCKPGVPAPWNEDPERTGSTCDASVGAEALEWYSEEE